jgi:hypothetical protein
VVRLDKRMVAAVDQLAARSRCEGGRRSRAAIVRSMVAQQIAQIDPVLPIAAQLPEERRPPRPNAARPREGATMREEILAVMRAAPGEVFTPAKLAPLVRAGSRDSVRNTLLVLAARGRIEKVGAGRYRANAGAEHAEPSWASAGVGSSRGQDMPAHGG